ncbi:MAG TPA: thioredoxin-like domain-containing protein [Candidatus Nitrosotenuis sp.]|jgi:thiol-disulfide isomerase/thioredoxin|nr:thioredoxin-like domain-containing protein [Candidatus Nitrosotenuis sp.]
MFESFFSITKAPDFPEGFDWINTDDPLTLSKLKGYIVVLDFWTYCCINCMHTLPVLAQLEKKYEQKPVVFIGVHSAKFTNEQETKNVEAATSRYEIAHPVIVDKKMRIWSSFGVNAWPTIIIIDPNGTIVYKQSGEGQKEAIEDVIEVLLQRHAQKGTLAKRPLKLNNTKPKHTRTLSFPGKLAISKDGILAISDSNHNRIIIANMAGKILHTIGSSQAGLLDGSFESCKFFRPQGVAWMDKLLYVADTENHAIRQIDFDKKSVSTVAGTGRQGPWVSAGGRGTTVSISSPWDVACTDNLVYIAMAGNHQIWVYDTQTSTVVPLAGSGHENIIDGPAKQAQLAQPSGLSISENTLYFADSETSSIRKLDLSEKQVTTIVGHGLFEFGHKDGTTAEALFQHPLGLSATGETIFVADTYNSAIRVINQKTNTVYTLIGKENDTACLPDNPHCDILGLYEPADVEFYNDKLYIADTNNHLIRVFDLKANRLQTLDLN